MATFGRAAGRPASAAPPKGVFATTTEPGPRSLLQTAIAGTVPFVWLVLGWIAINALQLGPNVDLALALMLSVAFAGVVLGASLLRPSRTRWPLVLTGGLLFVWLAWATWAGPTWIVCGHPVDAAKRFVLSLAAGALAVAGYGLATGYLDSSSRAGAASTVGGLLVAAGLTFVTLFLLLGLYGFFIDPALSCAAFPS